MVSYSLKNEMVKMFYDIDTSTAGFGTCFMIKKTSAKIGTIGYIILNGIKIETYAPNVYISNTGIVTFDPINKRTKGAFDMDFNDSTGLCKDVILNISVEKIEVSNRYTYALVVDINE